MFVIFDTTTSRIARKNCQDLRYTTLRAAKMVSSKMNIIAMGDSLKMDTGRYVAMSSEVFEKDHNPMVETQNILTGKTCMIRLSEKGGCTDPGTERYHSM